MTEELQKKAEDFIIERYKIAKCYREDNAETREYMRMDVHSQYEEEYQLYLDATKELEKENAELKEMYHESDEENNKLRENIPILAEAKELIKEYMRFEPMIGTCSFYSEEYEKTKTKAEAFLKE